MMPRRSSGSSLADSAVEPTRSQNITVIALAAWAPGVFFLKRWDRARSVSNSDRCLTNIRHPQALTP